MPKMLFFKAFWAWEQSHEKNDDDEQQVAAKLVLASFRQKVSRIWSPSLSLNLYTLSNNVVKAKRNERSFLSSVFMIMNASPPK